MAATITPLIQSYTVDFASNNNFLFLKTVQGDGHSTRYADISLMNFGQPYTFDQSAVNIVIRGTKPDGTQIFNTCEALDDHTIRFEITQQMSAVAGKVDCEISIMSNSENKTLTSFPFMIIVDPNAADVSYIVSSDEFTLLIEKINAATSSTEDAIKATEDMRELESDVKAAEEIRRENEDTRQSQEDARVKAEEARTKAEDARESAETIRNSNEDTRNSNEDTRVKAESARVTAEDSRVKAEEARVNAENTRVEQEDARKSAENQRVSAEKARESNESTRQEQESTRQSQESARQKAEEGRASAESVRVSQETARKNAENTRQTNEGTRESNEAIRQKNEQDRVASEQARVEAMQQFDEDREELHDYAIMAQSYATGGTGTRPGEDTDNAGYYYQMAKEAAEEAVNAIPIIAPEFRLDIETMELMQVGVGKNITFTLDENLNLIFSYELMN